MDAFEKGVCDHAAPPEGRDAAADETTGSTVRESHAEGAAGSHDAKWSAPRRHWDAAGHIHSAAERERAQESDAEEEVAEDTV